MLDKFFSPESISISLQVEIYLYSLLNSDINPLNSVATHRVDLKIVDRAIKISIQFIPVRRSIKKKALCLLYEASKFSKRKSNRYEMHCFNTMSTR